MAGMIVVSYIRNVYVSFILEFSYLLGEHVWYFGSRGARQEWARGFP